MSIISTSEFLVMALEAFLDPNSQFPISLLLPSNGGGSILEALSSHNSLRNEEHMDSVLRMAQLNANSASDVTMNSTFLENSSIPRSSLGNANMEPYCLPSAPMSFSGNNPMNVFQSNDAFSHLCRGRQKERKMQQLEITKGPKELCKTKSPICRASPPVKIKKEPGNLTPSPKKPRVDVVVNQENIHLQKQEFIEKLLLKEIQDRNTQLTAMIEKYGVQNQPQKPILHSGPQLRGFNLQVPKQMMRSTLQDQGNLQTAFAPLLDGGICARRLKQYLYHLRNNTHDNGIAYWQKFVSEYYAPGSKKRWCFCKYENIQLHTTGVFYPTSMEAWSCDICGSRSGKGLEATFDIFPRLFKTKFESGMLDEILFLDSPRACNISSGLVLEYRKAIQESVYEKFRVIHEGRLRIVFRHDLKILSWEFCAQNHEEFLLRRFITPEVNQLVQACKIYQYEIQNDTSFRVSSENLQTLCDTFVSAGDQLVRNMETPLVNDLGYPKQFIRCLQIAEVVDSMKDVMALSLETKMGPIECLNNISSQGIKARNQTKDKQRTEAFVGAQNLSSFPERPGPECLANIRQMSENRVMSGSGSSGSAFVNLNHQLVGQNPSIASMRRKWQDSGLTDHPNRAMGLTHSNRYSSPMSQSFTHGKNPHQALVDKLLHQMVSAQKTNQKCGTRNELLGYGESSIAASVQSNSGNASVSHGDSTAVSRNITVKIEPCSPEQVPEAFQSSALGSSKIEDMSW